MKPGNSRPQSTGKTKSVEAHCMHTKYGMGDYCGTGIKQKVGRMREDYSGMSGMTPKKLKTPPKSVV